MSIKEITAQELRQMKGQEGLVLQGCGGDPQEWLNGINSLLTEAGILKNESTLRQRAENVAVRQAAAFFKRMRNSYSSSGRSFACQPFNVRNSFDQILQTSKRVENVIIENQSFDVLIPHYDRQESFFYADPPYD